MAEVLAVAHICQRPQGAGPTATEKAGLTATEEAGATADVKGDEEAGDEPSSEEKRAALQKEITAEAPWHLHWH